MNIRMSTKGKRPLRSLTPSDKIHAIQRIHDGESKASVARDIGVPESTLRGWCKNEDKLRFMSRQSASDKLAADSLSDKLDASSCLMGGPAEKRIKLDSSMPLNFSNKLKYDDMTYKRASLNGLDYGTNKALAELTFNGLPPEYVAFNGTVKNKVFGADISRHGDQAIAAISPLSSLTHLSGLSGLAQSPLAISFNELTSNLNLLAQLNPGLAAMSGLNGLTGTASTLRNVKTKTPSQLHSPRSENGGVDHDRQHGLSVKNWAKQKTVTPTSGEANYGLNLSQNELKHKIKCPSPSLAPSLGGNMPPMASIPIADDPLLYWLKSQQAMLGLSSLYPPTAVGAASPPPPIRASTPQQAGHHANTPPITVAPLTPSSTPSGSLDDKNAAWFNWCKAFGASLNSLTPATVAAMHANSLQQPQPPTSTTFDESQKPTQSSPFDNILYSQLTKDAASPSIQSTSSADNASHSNKPNNETKSNGDSAGKPEDLSAKPTSLASPIPTPVQSPTASVTQTPVATPSQSPSARSDSDLPATAPNRSGGSVADCKDVLDSLLYKINNNNNPNTSLHSHMAAVSAEAGSESDGSYHSESNHNHSDSNANNNNNNNNSNKTDEEERARCAELNESEDDADAIKHGEKFLKWLENCSNPRVTAVQLMQLRFLISAIKCGNSGSAEVSVDDAGECTNAAAATPDAVLTTEDNTSPEESNRNKIRRRK